MTPDRRELSVNHPSGNVAKLSPRLNMRTMRFAGHFEVLAYILDVETDPERRSVLRNGQEVRQLAAREGLLTTAQDNDEFARLLFDLRSDGGLSFSLGPDYEPPPHGRLSVQQHHSDNAIHIRVTPAGRTAVLQNRIRDAIQTLAESLSTSFEAMESVIDSLPPDSPEATAARSSMNTARELLVSVVGSVGGTALTQMARQLGVTV